MPSDSNGRKSRDVSDSNTPNKLGRAGDLAGKPSSADALTRAGTHPPDPEASSTPIRPWTRCEVCGYRRWTHWLAREREFYTVSHIGPRPSRGWLW